MYKILVVDDDRNYRYAIHEICDWKALGFQIEGEAINGSQALRKIEAEKFDLVITDIDMPLMGGVELIKRAKELNPDLIFIALSAYDDFKFVKESLKEGAADYILKYDMQQQEVEKTVLKIRDMLDVLYNEEEKNRIVHDKNVKRKEIKKAMLYMNEHYSEPCTLQEVADFVGLNKNYFSNIFKEETGETFTKYFNQIRIRNAMKLLENGNIKNYEIAEQVGYQNASYFSRIFKEIAGMTVEDYRNRQPL